MSHEQYVVVEIRGVVFGERAARAEAVHDFHGLGVLDFVFAGYGNAPRRQQAGAEDDRADGVFIFRIPGPLVVVRQRPQLVDLNQAIQCDRGARCAVQLFLRAIGLDVEALAEFRHPFLYFSVGHLPPQRRQFIHFDDFDVSAEIGALLGEVGIDVEHSAVIMAHHAQAIVFHGVSDPRGFHPFRDFIPGNRIVFQHAGNLEKRDLAAIENIGDLRHRTGLAVGQPFARSFSCGRPGR